MTDYYDRLRQKYLQPQQEEQEEGLTVGGVVGDLALAPVRGVEGAVQGAYNVADFLTFDALPDYDERFLGHSDTIAGGFVEGLTQFAIPFAQVSKISKVGSLASKLGMGKRSASIFTAAVDGAITDAFFFNGDEGRLADLIQRVPALQNPITEFLATDEDDGFLEGRIKNVLEGAGLGVAVDLVWSGLKGIHGRMRGESPEKGSRRVERTIRDLKTDPYTRQVAKALDSADDEAEAVVALMDSMGIDRDSVQWERGGTAAEGALEQGREPRTFLGETLRSKLETVLSETDQKRWQPEQLRAFLLKKGVKETELFWSGFDEYLNLQPAKVDLDDARDAAERGGIELDLREAETVDTELQYRATSVGDLEDYEIEQMLDDGRISVDSYWLDEVGENILNSSWEDAKFRADRGDEPDRMFYGAEVEGRILELEDAIDEGIDLEGVSSSAKWVRVLDNGDVEGLTGSDYADLIADADREYWDYLDDDEKIRELLEAGYEYTDILPDGEVVTDDIDWTEPDSYKQAATETQFLEYTQPGPRDSYGETRIQIDHKSLPEGFNPSKGHFSDRNVVLHYRWSTREDALFIDEIQSDWHKKGRDYGYLPAGETPQPPTPYTGPDSPRNQRLKVELDEALQPDDFKVVQDPDRPDGPRLIVHEPTGQTSAVDFRDAQRPDEEIITRHLDYISSFITNDQALNLPEKFKALLPKSLLEASEDPQLKLEHHRWKAKQREASKGDQRMPEGPFKNTDTYALAMKRALSRAIIDGKAKLAWTTGEMQAAIYDSAMAGAVEQHRWSRGRDGLLEVELDLKRGTQVSMGVDPDTGKILTTGEPDLMDKNLEEVVGARAKEILAQPEGGTGEGLGDLTVGKTGMLLQYDQMMVKEGKKLAKKLKGKVSAPRKERWPGHSKEAVDSETGLNKTLEDVWVMDIDMTAADRQDLPPFDLFQRGEGSPPKGSVEFQRDGQAIIRGFKGSDVSTGVHELAHVARRRFFDMGVEDRLREGISDNDIRVTEEWAGVVNGEWTREAEEKFARGFERYILDGQAPDERLAGMFRKLRNFMVNIYRKIRGSEVDIEISPEMREVFDKLVDRTPPSIEDSNIQRAASYIESQIGLKLDPDKRPPRVREVDNEDPFGVENILHLEAFEGPADAKRLMQGVARAAAESDEVLQAVGRMSAPERQAQLRQYIEDVATGSEGTDTILDGLLSNNKKGIADLQKAIPQMLATRALKQEFSQRALPLFEKIRSGEYTPKEADEFLKIEEILRELLRDDLGFGRLFGQGLQARQQNVKGLHPDQRAAILDRLPKEKLEERAGLLADLIKEDNIGGINRIQNMSPMGKFMAMVNEYRIGALLYGPKTQMVNMLSGAAMMAYMPLERSMGTALMALRNDKDAKQRIAQAFDLKGGFALEYLNGLRQDAVEAIRYAGKALRSGEAKFTSDTTIDLVGERALSASTAGLRDDSVAGFGLNVLGSLMSVPGKTLAAGDEFFKQFNGRSTARLRLLQKSYDEGIRGPELHRKVNDDLMKAIHDGQIQSRQVLMERARAAAIGKKFASDEEKEAFLLEWMQRNFDPNLSSITDESELDAILKESKDYALQGQFQTPLTDDRGRFIAASRRLQNVAAEFPIARLVVPFIRTPVNLVDYAFGRTGLGVIRDAAALGNYFAKRAIGRGTPLEEVTNKTVKTLLAGSPQEQQELMGRLGASVMFFMAAQNLASSGRITGQGPSDPDQRKVMLEQGWRPYAFFTGEDPENPKPGEGYIALGRLDPFATIFGLFADTYDFARYATEEEEGAVEDAVLGLATALANNFTNKSYLQGIAETTEVLHDPQMSMSGYLRKFTGSFVPNIYGQGVSVEDEFMRSYEAVGKSDRNVAFAYEFINTIRGKLPGLSETLEARRNILGEKVRRSSTGWMSFVWPLEYATVSDSKINAELAALDHGFQPPRAERGNLNFREYTNASGQSAYDRWMELTSETRVGGKTLREQLTRLIESSGYQQMDPLPGPDGEKSPRVAELKRVIRRYQNRALQQVRREFPDLKAAEQSQLLLQRQRKLGLSSDLEGLIR